MYVCLYTCNHFFFPHFIISFHQQQPASHRHPAISVFLFENVRAVGLGISLASWRYRLCSFIWCSLSLYMLRVCLASPFFFRFICSSFVCSSSSSLLTFIVFMNHFFTVICFPLIKTWRYSMKMYASVFISSVFRCSIVYVTYGRVCVRVCAMCTLCSGGFTRVFVWRFSRRVFFRYHIP